MNFQREAIYSRRRNAISGERIEIDVLNMISDSAALLVEQAEGLPFEDFEQMVIAKYSVDCGFDAEFYNRAKLDDIAQKLSEHMLEVYNRRMEGLITRVLPIVKQVYENQGKLYQNIALPIADGRKMINLSVDLKKAYESEGKEIAKRLSQTIILYQIDEHWKQHLREMDDLKQSVQNASYEQKDPLVVYKLEAYNLFAAMLEALNQDVLSFLLRAGIALRDDAPARHTPAPAPAARNMSQMRTEHQNLTTNGEQKSNSPIKVDKQVGRNDPCPCGSGLKYKNCHGRNNA